MSNHIWAIIATPKKNSAVIERYMVLAPSKEEAIKPFEELLDLDEGERATDYWSITCLPAEELITEGVLYAYD